MYMSFRYCQCLCNLYLVTCRLSEIMISLRWLVAYQRGSWKLCLIWSYFFLSKNWVVCSFCIRYDLQSTSQTTVYKIIANFVFDKSSMVVTWATFMTNYVRATINIKIRCWIISAMQKYGGNSEKKGFCIKNSGRLKFYEDKKKFLS